MHTMHRMFFLTIPAILAGNVKIVIFVLTFVSIEGQNNYLPFSTSSGTQLKVL